LVQLEFCTVEKTDWGCCVRFPDGSSCPAVPHDSHHYHVVAHRCGYGDDVHSYCFEHEFAHAFVEERLHRRPSRVLWALAHGGMLSGKDAAYEEIAAQTFQRFLRANEEPIVGGVEWHEMKRDALALLSGR
jgi:hypothetical protein